MEIVAGEKNQSYGIVYFQKNNPLEGLLFTRSIDTLQIMIPLLLTEISFQCTLSAEEQMSTLGREPTCYLNTVRESFGFLLMIFYAFRINLCCLNFFWETGICTK